MYVGLIFIFNLSFSDCYFIKYSKIKKKNIFHFFSAKLESVAYCWTENDPICMEFIRASDGQVMTVEQKISRKGEITAEICSYEIGQAKMQRVAVTSIPIGTQICCHGFSPDQEKLVLGTIDRYVCIHDLVQKVTKFAPKTDIVSFVSILKL